MVMPNQVTTMTTFTRMNFYSNTSSILNNEGQGQQIQILVNVDELEIHLHGKQPITTKWVFKIKCQVSGALDKFKARLVAHGFE